MSVMDTRPDAFSDPRKWFLILFRNQKETYYSNDSILANLHVQTQAVTT